VKILSQDGRCLAESQTKRLLITSLRRYQYTTLLDELSTDMPVPEKMTFFYNYGHFKLLVGNVNRFSSHILGTLKYFRGV